MIKRIILSSLVSGMLLGSIGCCHHGRLTCDPTYGYDTRANSCSPHNGNLAFMLGLHPPHADYCASCCDTCDTCASCCDACCDTCAPCCDTCDMCDPCCDTCGPCDTCCGSHRCHHGPLSWLSELFSGPCANGGCGERYWGDFYDDPPYCNEPCDCHGRWTGCAGAYGDLCGMSVEGCSTGVQDVASAPRIISQTDVAVSPIKSNGPTRAPKKKR